MIRPWFDRELSREILHLALPVVAGYASITAIGLTDTVMVGRLGAEALAATGQCAMIFWALYWILRSIEIATQALVARRFGENRPEECGKILTNALVLSLMISLPGMFLLYFAAPFVIRLISTHERVIVYAVAYIQTLVVVLWAGGLFFAMRGFFSGIGRTRLFLGSALVLFVMNLIGNYLFIFGHFEMPRLEVQGAAIGSAISMFSGLVFMIVMVARMGSAYPVFHTRQLDLTIIKEIARLGAPNAFRGVMVIGGLLVFYGMVDKLGVIQVAVVNVILNIQSVSFMPGYGFGVAAATLIGQNLGAQDPEKAERSGYEAMKLGMVLMGSIGVLFFLIPETIIGWFTDDAAVIENAIFPLWMVGFIQILDAAGMVMSTALEGAGNTRWVMMAEIVVNWGIFLPLTYVSVFVLQTGHHGPWWAWATYITIFGIWCLWKFRQGKWKEIRI